MNRKFPNERDKQVYGTYGTFCRGSLIILVQFLCDLQTDGSSILVFHISGFSVFIIFI